MEHLRSIFDNTNRWLAHVEQKNLFLLVANGIFLGIVFPYIQKTRNAIFITVLSALLISVLLVSFAANIVSFIPFGQTRRWSVNKYPIGNVGGEVNHLYYEDIYKNFNDGKTYYAYWKQLYHIDDRVFSDFDENVLIQYCNEIWINARITYKKAQLAAWSARFDLLGIVMLLVLILLGIKNGR